MAFRYRRRYALSISTCGGMSSSASKSIALDCQGASTGRPTSSSFPTMGSQTIHCLASLGPLAGVAAVDSRRGCFQKRWRAGRNPSIETILLHGVGMPRSAINSAVFRRPYRVSDDTPNQALQQTAGAGSLFEGQCSSGPRRC